MARAWPYRARSPRSSRITSRRTAPSGYPRRCASTWADSTSSGERSGAGDGARTAIASACRRLLHWPDPEGPVTADLLPVGYPDDLPPEIVDRSELRFLGSVVRRRAGALVGAEMVFEGPGEPEVVVLS